MFMYWKEWEDIFVTDSGLIFEHFDQFWRYMLLFTSKQSPLGVEQNHGQKWGMRMSLYATNLSREWIIKWSPKHRLNGSFHIAWDACNMRITHANPSIHQYFVYIYIYGTLVWHVTHEERERQTSKLVRTTLRQASFYFKHSPHSSTSHILAKIYINKTIQKPARAI